MYVWRSGGVGGSVRGFPAILIDPASHRMDREERSREERGRGGRGSVFLWTAFIMYPPKQHHHLHRTPPSLHSPQNLFDLLTDHDRNRWFRLIDAQEHDIATHTNARTHTHARRCKEWETWRPAATSSNTIRITLRTSETRRKLAELNKHAWIYWRAEPHQDKVLLNHTTCATSNVYMHFFF